MSQWYDIISDSLLNSQNENLQASSSTSSTLEDLIESSILNQTKDQEESPSLFRTAAIFELILHLFPLSDPDPDRDSSQELQILLDECLVKIQSFSCDTGGGLTPFVDDLITELIEDLNETIINGQLTFQGPSLLLNLIFKLTIKEENLIVQAFVIGFIERISQLSKQNRKFIAETDGISELLTDSILLNFPKDSTTITNTLCSLLKTCTITSSTLISLFRPLITGNSTPDEHQKHLCLLSSLLDRDNDSFYHFKNSSLKVTLESTSPVSSYTAQLWIRFNGPPLDSNETPQTVLSINNRITLKVHASKIVIYYKNIKIETIDTVQIVENQVYHIVLIHEDRSITFGSPKLRIYVNAQHFQTLKCPYPIDNDPSFTTKPSITQIDLILGSDLSTDMDIYNCLLVSSALGHEWLVLSYYLGKNYQNSFQDSNLLRFLNYDGRSHFNLKLLNLSKRTEIACNLEDLKFSVPRENVLFNLNPNFVKFGKKESTTSNLITMIGNSMENEIQIENEIKYYKSQDTSELFYAISPFQPIFQAIESSRDLDSLYLATETLLKIASCNWKLVEEFETMNGYNLLSTILKLKKAELKTNLSMKFLDLFLRYSGYDSTASYNSVIINPICYDNVVLDFQLWRPLGSKMVKTTPTIRKEDLELSKSLISQINVFTHECRNSSFNVLKLKKFKLIKRLLNCLSQNYFPFEINDTIQRSLSNLVRANLTTDTIKTLSSFVIYSLSEGQFQYATTTLNVLAEVFLDPLVSNASFWRKLFACVSIKWIFLLIQLSKNDKYIVDVALSFLIKIFSVNGKSWDLFLKNNGLQILLGSLRDVKFDEVEINILINGSFGHYQHDLCFDLSSSSSQNCYPTKKKNDHQQQQQQQQQLMFPTLHYLIIDLLEWTVLNDIFKEDSHEKIIHLIQFYLDFLQRGINDDFSEFAQTLAMDKTFLKRLCGFVILLTKPQNASIYHSPSGRIIDMFSGFIMTKLTNTSAGSAGSAEVEHYVTSVLSSSAAVSTLSGGGGVRVGTGGGGILSLENDLRGKAGLLSILPTVFLCLVIPKVLMHIKEFSSEFDTLLEVGGMSFTNFAVFFNVVNNELLTFEWEMTDYFNYMSVLLDLLEAYRKFISNSNSNSSGSGNKKNNISIRNPHYLQVAKNVTHLVNVLLVLLNDSSETAGRDRDRDRDRDTFLRLLIFHQENLFANNGYVSNDGIGNLISFLLGTLDQARLEDEGSSSSLSLNCLRIILMQRQSDIGSISSSITFRHYSSLFSFLTNAITLGDEDLIFALEANDSKWLTLFKTHLSSLSSKLERNLIVAKSSLCRKVADSQESAIAHKYEKLEALVRLLKSEENQILKSKILTNEGIRLSRFLQDQHDSLQFFVSSYNEMKLDRRNEISVRFNLPQLGQTIWTLDTAEGIDRTRKVLLPHKSSSSTIPTSSAADNKINIQNMGEMSTNSVGGGRRRRMSSNDPERDERVKIESLSLNSFEMVDHAIQLAQDPAMANHNDKNRKVLKCLSSGDQICEIWNVSRVVGLEITEGILILGQSHLYLVENYYHNAADDEIVNIEDVAESERDPNVQLITGQTASGSNSGSSKNVNNHLVHTWDLFELTSVTKRQFLLRDVALELFFSDGGSFLITSIQTRERDIIYSKLSNVATNSNIDDDLSKIFKATNAGTNNYAKGNTANVSFTVRLANVFASDFPLDATKKWQNGEISNFYYLMIINTLAGRTFNDLTQYPVFPWVIADYTSDELDLSDPKSFRDLSKPMGAQSASRAQQFKERYEALESLQDEDSPPFHYGTHYSSAMIIASFLIRLEPFVQSYLLLQGGKFDHADRLFYSIEKAWKSSSTENTTDVRELIPEFFFLPEFLTNINQYDFGKLQDGITTVSDVELPKWAKGDPKIFIAKNREALESPYVSEHLHEWLDLIFGVKQSGPLAVESINVFNHLSYHGAIDLDSINNEDERRSITGIIHNFGQTPLQIFSKPHASRMEQGLEHDEFSLRLDTVATASHLKTVPNMLYQTKFKSPIEFLQFKLHSDNRGDAFWRGYPALHLKNVDFEIRPDDETPGSLLINRQCFERLHDERITALALLSRDVFLTGSESGCIHMWKVNSNPQAGGVDLQLIGPLRLHSSSVKELKVSPEFNLLLSLDIQGNVMLWNLVDCSFIRSIDCSHLPVQHIAISYESGLIATSQNSQLTIFTINGQEIITYDTGEIITCLNFANSRTVTSFKSSSFPVGHEYWNHQAVIAVGLLNGEIPLFLLKINDSKDEGGASWDLKIWKTLEFADKQREVPQQQQQQHRREITVVESYLKSYMTIDDEKKTKIEVIAGDYNGRVAVWR